MFRNLPKNLNPKFFAQSKIPFKVKEVMESVFNKPVSIENDLNLNNVGTPLYQVSSLNNNKHICEYKHLDNFGIVNYIKNYEKNKKVWDDTPFNQKKEVFLNAADLIENKYYHKMLAYTILGQNKNVYEAEIDSICELVDFLRFNVYYTEQILSKQPIQTPGINNISEYNSLNGFVASITPFNFTAIGGNLASAPLLFGNSVLWKPSDNAILSNYLFYEIMHEAGLPKGVLNFSPMDPINFLNLVISRSDLAAILFTGSSSVMDNIYSKVGENICKYNNYPRIIGETGGKNFHFVGHIKDNIINKLENIATKTIESSFNYSGQKCSACSILYIPSTNLNQLIALLINKLELYNEQKDNYGVINRKSYNKLNTLLYELKNDEDIYFITSDKNNDANSYDIKPHILICKDHKHRVFNEEFFGPILAIYPYDIREIDETMDICIKSNNYALTGSIFSDDIQFIDKAKNKFKNKTGNFYINDKSTGSVVGQQPFGGSGKSGTNDKAGDINLLFRLFNQRNIKVNNLF